MSDDRVERRLAEGFARLKAEDARRAPPFDRVFGEAVRRAEDDAGSDGGSVIGWRRRRRWAAAAGLAAAAAIGGILLAAPDGDEAFEDAVASWSATVGDASSWRSPTAGLLDVPGNELLTTVPSIGSGVTLEIDLPGDRG